MRETILSLLLLSVPATAVNCPKGSTEYGGVCASDQTPEGGPSAKPSDEKPPQDKMPSYEREGIKAATPPSLAPQIQAQMDAEKAADKAGKLAAGIN